MSEIKNASLAGIKRNLPATVAEDFSCCEAVNMYQSGGVWRPTNDYTVVIENNPLSNGLNLNAHEPSAEIKSMSKVKLSLVRNLSFKNSYWQDGKYDEVIDIDAAIEETSNNNDTLVCSIIFNGALEIVNAGKYALCVRYTDKNDSSFTWGFSDSNTVATTFSAISSLENATQINQSVIIPKDEVLVTKETLKPPLIHKPYGSIDYVYNNNLFLGNIRMKMFKGYSMRDYNGSVSGAFNVLTFVVQIKTDDGIKLVVADSSLANAINGEMWLPTMIMYPDKRATNIFLYYRGLQSNPTKEVTCLAKQWALTPHNTLNIAYYANKPFSGLEGTLWTNLDNSLTKFAHDWEEAVIPIPNDIIENNP